MRRHISIRGCVRPSVRPSVRRCVTPSLRRVLGASCAVYSALFKFKLHCLLAITFDKLYLQIKSDIRRRLSTRAIRLPFCAREYQKISMYIHKRRQVNEIGLLISMDDVGRKRKNNSPGRLT